MWSVFFVFLSYLDRNFVKGDFLSLALDAEKEGKEMFSMLNGTFCAKLSKVEENFLYQVSDGAEVVRSVVSHPGKLVNCSVLVNKMQVKSFMHECRLGLKEQRAGPQLDTRFARMDEAKEMCRDFKERSGRSDRVKKNERDDAALQHMALKRSKRGFTYPGTLWCGAGNMADHYDQLGNFAETDSCCRTHDHCPNVIHAFSSNYGYTNFKWYPICHCDCDNALKDCLRKVNDTSSRVVGQAFFNVIGVPCFELVYEEQCAERHWYGLCKRYEKLPVAVLKEAVPYDFGGIDVIDELTVAPPKKKNSKKNEDEEKAESTTPSTVSGPDEPSLTNVVTAAEDFIKVLATVSTSQSSTADSGKDETQNSEKKKRKNAGKKKKTTKKENGKGKGRKRKQKAEAGVKIEEGAAVSPSGSKAEKAIALTNFINESRKHEQSSGNRNRVDGGEYEHGGKEEPYNEVMKDEPAIDKETVSITSPTTVQRRPADSDTDALTEKNTFSISMTTAIPQKVEKVRLRKGRKKKSKKTPLPSSETLTTNTTGYLCSAPSIFPSNPSAEPVQESFRRDTVEQPNVTAANTPTVISRAKCSRSKDREDRKARKKRRKMSSVALIVAVSHKNSSEDNLIPLTRATSVPSSPTTERQVSHRSDFEAGNMTVHIAALNSSFSVLKRQRSKERALRHRRRKPVLPVSSEKPPIQNISDDTLPNLTTLDTKGALNNPAVSRLTGKPETQSEWRLFTTAATTVRTRPHRQTMRQHRKPGKKALSGGVSDIEQTEQTLTTFTTTPSKVAIAEELGLLRSGRQQMTTSANHTMSPIQLSIERAKAQFTRKKRKKAAQSIRQQ
ncbi:uncharacterized protein proca1 [Mastacembelus armatus]|uniref:phospholipase A2 n=1 Tax=Mastacembelus armatus TaxID=205130 RepID=A0A3Q3MJW5_9TELE|nr:protein PROCA1 [Mastacembelus armatus]